LNLGKETVRVVLEDWRSASIPKGLKLTLGFLEKLTLTPVEVGPEDAQKLKRAGVSEKAIEEAVFVCFLFNFMDRLADAFDFHVPLYKVGRRLARVVNVVGYR
jgi:alkylhydroperoxidase family enzyme